MGVSDMKARFRAGTGLMVSVHRGLWSESPENSCSGIQKAAAWDVVEVDVRLDATGRAYLIHDQSLLRTTGVDLPSNGVDPFILAKLTLRDGGGDPQAAMTSEPVPWLADGFAALDGRDAIFDLDVKRAKDLPAVAREVADLGETCRATLKVNVAAADDIQALKDLEAAYGVMVMAKVRLEDRGALEILHALKAADVAVVEVKYANPELLAAGCAIGRGQMRISILTLDIVHTPGFSDSAALVDPDAVWGRLVDAGAGLVMTDQPQALVDWYEGTATQAGRA